MIEIREAREEDAEAIHEIFHLAYGDSYVHPEFCEVRHLKKLIFDDDTIVIVAEEEGKILGTASIILDLGGFGDLLGEFGRLVVHPEARGKGLGSKLMEGRLERVQDRLHLAVVENRASHPFSQKISAHFGFTPVGFLPGKWRFGGDRESIALYGRCFGDCLPLRRNHPRVVPEVYPLADAVLRSAEMENDLIVDEESAAYALDEDFEIEAMTSRGYTSLLHFERGRVVTREILGPVKLHAGFFQIRVSHYRYLLAKRNGGLAGGIGYHIDEVEQTARILELVSADTRPLRFLLTEVLRRCRDEENMEYLEVDVSAHAPEMQRTLNELGFFPAAYIPAMSFHRVERLDVVRMVALFAELDLEKIQLHETTEPVANVVLARLRHPTVVPRIAAAIPEIALFQGLDDRQAHQLASLCLYRQFSPGETLSHEGENDGCAFLILSGQVDIRLDKVESTVARLEAGQTIGEVALLLNRGHRATSVATSDVEAALLEREGLETLLRRDPQLGQAVYRNLATELGEKLLATDRRIASGE